MQSQAGTFSIIRLNNGDLGWGVVHNDTGALVKLPTEGGRFALAVRLSKVTAKALAERLSGGAVAIDRKERKAWTRQLGEAD